MENGEMKDRIAHIIRAKNMTAGEFANRLGIQPSNVSHLLSGRNNPSLDFVKKLKETFPEYNLDWIIMGLGPMTVSEPLLPNAPSAPADDNPPTLGFEEEPIRHTPSEDLPLEAHPEPSELRNALAATGIILLFGDDTYKMLRPR